MRRLLLSFVSALALTFVATAASADNYKIGVIDVEQIMQKSPQIAAINDQLTKEFKPRQDKIVAAQKSLQDEVDKFNRNSAVMNPGDRNRLQDQINSDKGNVQTQAIAFQRDLNFAQQQAMQGFMGQLSAVVAQIAKDQKYDLVLQRAGVPYASSNLDITAQVLAAMKAKG